MDSTLTNDGLLQISCPLAIPPGRVWIVDKKMPPLLKVINYDNIFHTLTKSGIFELLVYEKDRLTIRYIYPQPDACETARVLDFGSQSWDRYALLLSDNRLLLRVGQFQQILPAPLVIQEQLVRIQFRACQDGPRLWAAVLLVTEGGVHYLTFWDCHYGWICTSTSIVAPQLRQVKLSLDCKRVHLIGCVNDNLMTVLVDGSLQKLVGGDIMKAHLSDDMHLTTLERNGELVVREKKRDQFIETLAIVGVANFKAVRDGLLIWKLPHLVKLVDYKREIFLPPSSYPIVFEDRL